jgi:hypothetical protein
MLIAFPLVQQLLLDGSAVASITIFSVTFISVPAEVSVFNTMLHFDNSSLVKGEFNFGGWG